MLWVRAMNDFDDGKASLGLIQLADQNVNEVRRYGATESGGCSAEASRPKHIDMTAEVLLEASGRLQCIHITGTLEICRYVDQREPPGCAYYSRWQWKHA